MLSSNDRATEGTLWHQLYLIVLKSGSTHEEIKWTQIRLQHHWVGYKYLSEYLERYKSKLNVCDWYIITVSFEKCS